MDPEDRDRKLLQNVSKYLIYHAKFEVSTAVLLKIQVLLDVMGNTNPVTKTVSCHRQHESSTTYLGAWHHIAEEVNLHQHNCENLTSRTRCSTWQWDIDWILRCHVTYTNFRLQRVKHIYYTKMFLIQALDLNKIQVLYYVLVLNINIKEPGHIPKCKDGSLKKHIIRIMILKTYHSPCTFM